MKKVSQQTIETIRQRCDIADVIQTYVPLKRSGSSLKACCPFHKEKTPSFHVNPARQIYHCFGCGAGGDVFRFVMEYEKADFMTAVRLLAQRAGVPIEVDEDERRETSNKDRLLRVHEAAASLFQKLMAEDPGAGDAREYLRRRQLDGEAARRFRIGWSPDRFDAILEWGRANGFEPELLEAAGLAVRNEKGLYDRFRKRVMFPICDEQGRVIGFSGRVLREEDSPAKYVNSPETPLFRKSRVLYAIDKARRAIIEQRQAILCEGQIDTLRCHLAGIENAVAAQGTAVTEEHARILKRYGDEVVVMLDADKAGQDAAIRSAQILMAAGLSVRLATLPPGEDPDSMILKEGSDAILRVLAAAESAPFFVIRVADQRGEMAGEAGRTRTVRAVLELIAAAPMESTREDLLRQAGARLGIPIDALRSDFRALPRRGEARGGEGDEPAGPSGPAAPVRLPEEMAVLEVAIHHPEQRALLREHLPPGHMSDPLLRRMLEALLARAEGDVRSLAADAGDDAEFARLAAELEMESRWIDGIESSPERAARDCILRVWRATLERRRRNLLALAARASGRERDELGQQMMELTLQLKTLQRGWAAALPVLELGA
ncbi:MAG: DNA primase [Verrucomicrobia bacterium]|nr:DNA primase [Verrucomicrobiota bacterium]